MKRTLFVLLLSLLFCQEAAAQAGPVVYSLPRTTVSLRVTARREAFTAGPYAPYAQKYLGVAAPTQDYIRYTLQSITLTPCVEADPAARFTISVPERSSVGFLQLCAQGLVAIGDGCPPSSPAWRFAPAAGAASFEGIDPSGNLGTQTTTLYKAVLTDDGYERVPVTQDNLVEKPADRKAADAAAAIFNLREKRQQIATGDTDATFSGEALQAAINEITRLEERYLSLFYGIREISEEEKSFDVTPDPEAKTQRYTAFRISDKSGLLPASADEGKAVTMEFIAEALAPPESASDRSKEPLVHYRIPAVTRCRVVQDGAILLENRVLVYQLGEESTLPLNVLLSK